MKRVIQAVTKAGLTVAIALSASLAQADGFYIGVGAYQANVDIDDFDEDDTVPAGFVGYQFLDTNFLMLSVELGYYDLGDFSGDNNINFYEVESDALTLAGVVYVPIGPFFEIYAKAGIASTNVDVEINGQKDDFGGEDAFGGVGFSFDILDTIDIYAEYLIFDNEVDSEAYGVGVRLAF